MDTIRFRTLAYKSVLGFGKYGDITVNDVLNLGHTLYLRWVYYNCDMISFHEDILDKIGITSEHKIEKPGKNPELHEVVTKIIQSKMCGFTKLKMRSHQKKVAKGKMKHKLRKDYISHQKGKLQAVNQGKF